MRHSIPFVTMIVISILVVSSCAKKDAPVEPIPGIGPLVKGTVLAHNAPFFTRDPLGDPVWDRALDFGTEIQVDYSSNSKEFIIAAEPMVLVFATIKSEKGEITGFVREGQVTRLDVKPAAVIAESATVTDGNSETLTILGRRSLVVTAEGNDSGDTSLVTVYLNNPSDKNRVLTGRIPKAALTYNKSDVAAAVLITAALAARDEQDRKAMLDKALRLHGDAVFADDIAVLSGAAPNEAQTGPACESLVTTLTVKNDAAKVRTEPEDNAAVAGTIAFDEQASVVERTVEQHETAAGKARWYRINGPIVGWIHGTDLEGAD
jgi:hypothetical protein